MEKRASSQSAWALLAEAVTEARVELHRLEHLQSRAMRLVEDSTHKDHVHQVAGDIITGAPDRLNAVKRALDRGSYALSLMGTSFLKGRIPQDDKLRVEDAMASTFGGSDDRSAAIASAWMQRVAQYARIDRGARRKVNQDLDRKGFGGLRRWRSVGQAMNAATGVLSDHGLQLDDVVSADRFRGVNGHVNFFLAWSNEEDPFSPKEISNSMLAVQWTKLDTDRYEFVAYLS